MKNKGSVYFDSYKIYFKKEILKSDSFDLLKVVFNSGLSGICIEILNTNIFVVYKQ